MLKNTLRRYEKANKSELFELYDNRISHKEYKTIKNSLQYSYNKLEEHVQFVIEF